MRDGASKKKHNKQTLNLLFTLNLTLFKFSNEEFKMVVLAYSQKQFCMTKKAST